MNKAPSSRLMRRASFQGPPLTLRSISFTKRSEFKLGKKEGTMSFTRFQKTVFAVLCATHAGGSVVAMDNSTTPEDIEKIEQACNLAFNIMNNVPEDGWLEVSMIQYKVSSACLTAQQFASNLEGKCLEEQWKAIRESLSGFNEVVESFESFLSEFRRNTVARIFITTKSQSDDLLDALVQMKENILFLQKGKPEETEKSRSVRGFVRFQRMRVAFWKL